MSTAGSVTHWIAQLKTGDHSAAQHLWEGYYHRLIERARQKLAGTRRRAADEEDVVLSAFDSFCRGVQHGRLPRLHDRQDLWQVLVVITDRKAIDLVYYEGRAKRGGGKVVGEGELVASGSSGGEPAFAQLEGREPSPEFAAQMAEEFGRLLSLLGDAELQRLAVLKMEGYTVEEVAAQLGYTPRTVQRRLELIRRIWEAEAPS
jgi:DNA-directed RNA polymerase specialized sigma24 family protein